MLLFISLAFAIKPKTAYMLKSLGKEQYIVRVKNVIRAVKASELLYIKRPFFVYELEDNGDDTYSLRFCDGKYLVRKEKDPGIVIGDKKNKWEFVKTTDGFKLRESTSKNCLIQTYSKDKKTKGYFMNHQNCDKKKDNEFVLLEMGDVDFHCITGTGGICKKLNFRG